MGKINLHRRNWRDDPISQKQIERIETMEEDLGIDREKTMDISGSGLDALENLTKGEASDLISVLEDSY
jgi:hypothetical protein